MKGCELTMTSSVKVARIVDTRTNARAMIKAAMVHHNLCQNHGLLGFSNAHGYENEIHINQDKFDFDALPGEVQEISRGCGAYPWGYVKEFEGYKFMFISRERITKYASNLSSDR